MARRSSRRNGAPPAPNAIRDEYAQDTARLVIDAISSGRLPEWTQAWRPGEDPLPRNALTGRTYQGVNVIRLLAVSHERGWEDPRWVTFKQALELDAHVRKGERGTPVIFWQDSYRKRSRDAEGRPATDGQGRPVYESSGRGHPFIRRARVFNAAQVEGLKERNPVDPGWDRHAAAEAAIAASGAEIVHPQHAPSASYSPDRDRIELPARARFPTRDGYYQSLLHEMSHWTGHDSRLARPTLRAALRLGYGSRDYAQEEIRAELGALLMGGTLQVGWDPNRSAAYMKSWIEPLRDDPGEIYRASRDAQRIHNFVLPREREREIEAAREPAALATRAPLGTQGTLFIGARNAPPASAQRPQPSLTELAERAVERGRQAELAR